MNLCGRLRGKKCQNKVVKINQSMHASYNLINRLLSSLRKS